jgi:hypothetical protein
MGVFCLLYYGVLKGPMYRSVLERREEGERREAQRVKRGLTALKRSAYVIIIIYIYL